MNLVDVAVRICCTRTHARQREFSASASHIRQRHLSWHVRCSVCHQLLRAIQMTLVPGPQQDMPNTTHIRVLHWHPPSDVLCATTMSIILTLSSNSLRNTTIDSNAEDIHYVISTPQGPFSATSITTIRRLDKDSGEYVLVAQLETNIYKKDRMRLLNPTVTSDFVPVDELLKRNALLASTRYVLLRICFARLATNCIAFSFSISVLELSSHAMAIHICGNTTGGH